ncbi:MAG: zinc ABC transporter substrate-binding protein [Chloroflexi bacterium]|nr:zinc ABC transporter substrate-binding protein [Chloroflexota bacterium]
MPAAQFVFRLVLPFASLLAACAPVANSDSEKMSVVASTQIIGDVVNAIAGDLVDVVYLIPPGTDPHAFEPTPQDAVRLAEADLVFINGFGLEQTLQYLLDEQNTKVVTVSDGIQPLALQEEQGMDPHVWMNPLNVKIWADNIAQALRQADRPNAVTYGANAQAYKTEIGALDAWAVEQIDQIQAEDRVLVTDHESFDYFAAHYGFEIIGAIIPGYSTLDEPSAGDLADLETSIQQIGVKAIFVGMSLNPSLAKQVAEDTGVQLIPVYTETLSSANGPASTYLEMIRFDVEAIVAALK